MKEDFKYQIIKKLVEVSGNKKAAALRIGCSELIILFIKWHIQREQLIRLAM